jgi:hypothetical protein
MVFRNWRSVGPMLIVMLGSSLLACVHRTGSASPKSPVAIPFGHVDKPNYLPNGQRDQKRIDRDQEKIGETLKRLNPGAGVRRSPAAPQSMIRPEAEPQQPIVSVGTNLPPYSVVLTYPTPASDTRKAAVPSAAQNNAVGLERGSGRLRSGTATLIAVALIAAMVWLPRLRHRGQTTRRQGT